MFIWKPTIFIHFMSLSILYLLSLLSFTLHRQTETHFSWHLFSILSVILTFSTLQTCNNRINLCAGVDHKMKSPRLCSVLTLLCLCLLLAVSVRLPVCLSLSFSQVFNVTENNKMQISFMFLFYVLTSQTLCQQKITSGFHKKYLDLEFL